MPESGYSCASCDPSEADRANAARFALEEAVSRHGLLSISSFFLAVLSAVTVLRLCRDSGGVLSALIEYDVRLPAVLLAIFFCAAAHGFLQAALYRNRRRAAALTPGHERKPPRKAHGILSGLLIAGIAAGVLAANVLVSEGPNHLPASPEQYAALNLPLLEQICPREWSVILAAPEASVPGEGADCTITQESRRVAPKILLVRQYAPLYPMDPDPQPQRFGYNVRYFEMKSEFLALRYAAECAGQLNAEGRISLQLEGFDSAVYGADETVENLVLRSGNVVITALYYGSGSLLDSAGLFSQFPGPGRN